MKVKFTANRAGINAVARAPFMQREVDRCGQLVERAAQQHAPVRTGRYRALIHRRSGTRPTGAYSTIIAGAPYSIWVERGNSRGAPAQHVMARALLAARG